MREPDAPGYQMACKIVTADAVAGVAQRWFDSMSKFGTDENVQYRSILHYLEDEFSGIHLQFATTALSIFRTQVETPLDAAGERSAFNTILDAFLMGFRLEFAFDNACAELLERSREEGGLEQILKFPQVDGTAEILDLPKVTRLLVPDALPWPSDLQCRCGASLKRFLYCCSPDIPLEIAPYQAQLRPGFQIKRECCGAMLSGFRCDCCHQLYTWDLGVAAPQSSGGG